MNMLQPVVLTVVAALLFSAVALNVPHPDALYDDIPVATDEVAVRIKPGSIDPDELASAHGYINMGQVSSLKDTYHFVRHVSRRGEPHDEVHASPHVEWSQTQVRRQRFQRDANDPARQVPTDPLYGSQWHLHGAAVAVNAEQVWTELGITGAGVTVAIVDDGLEKNHPDIRPNFNQRGSRDVNFGDDDPTPSSYDSHGTSAGGVACAAPNSVCGVGAAHGAQVSGIRLIATGTTDVDEANGLSYGPQVNDIYSCSWGPNDDGRRLEGPGPLTQAAIADVVTNGRAGKGGIFVWAGGNGRGGQDNCNYDGYANSRYTIAIAALDFSGQYPWYSEPCSALLVSAPSSGGSHKITTTDLQGSAGASRSDCSNSFGGTSAAAPLAAGVVALMLEAKPELSWRDVQGVLIASAQPVDENNSGWIVNGGGHKFSHDYGFGRVDAYAAVTTALNWTLLPEAVTMQSGDIATNQQATNTPASSTHSVSDNFVVEHVEAQVWLSTSSRGNAKIVLRSPSGTESLLQDTHRDTRSDIEGWTYVSMAHWGEQSQGDWTLTVYNTQSVSSMTLQKWQLNLYGH